MKLGFLLPASNAVGSPFNGVREQAYFQTDALKQLGHEVIRMSPWEKYSLEEFDFVQFYTGGPHFHEIGKRSPSPIARLVFAPIIDTKVPNIFYRASALLGDQTSKIKTIQSYFRQQARESALVIARSKDEHDKLIKGLGAEPSKVKIVLNGTPAPNDNADPDYSRKKFEIDSDFVFHLSRITNDVKNVITMIKAIGPTGIPLVLGGTADEQSKNFLQIKSLVDKFRNIRWIGRVTEDEKQSLYSACKVFCLPSHFEGTGLVAVEAASYGAHIIITANGGPPDYFLNFAWYTKTGSLEEIQRHVQEAFNSPKSNNLRDHVRNHLTWKNSGASLVAAYESVIGR